MNNAYAILVTYTPRRRCLVIMSTRQELLREDGVSSEDWHGEARGQSLVEVHVLCACVRDIMCGSRSKLSCWLIATSGNAS